MFLKQLVDEPKTRNLSLKKKKQLLEAFLPEAPTVSTVALSTFYRKTLGYSFKRITEI